MQYTSPRAVRRPAAASSLGRYDRIRQSLKPSLKCGIVTSLPVCFVFFVLNAVYINFQLLQPNDGDKHVESSVHKQIPRVGARIPKAAGVPPHFLDREAIVEQLQQRKVRDEAELRQRLDQEAKELAVSVVAKAAAAAAAAAAQKKSRRVHEEAVATPEPPKNAPQENVVHHHAHEAIYRDEIRLLSHWQQYLQQTSQFCQQERSAFQLDVERYLAERQRDQENESPKPPMCALSSMDDGPALSSGANQAQPLPFIIIFPSVTLLGNGVEATNRTFLDFRPIMVHCLRWLLHKEMKKLYLLIPTTAESTLRLDRGYGRRIMAWHDDPAHRVHVLFADSMFDGIDHIHENHGTHTDGHAQIQDHDTMVLWVNEEWSGRYEGFTEGRLLWKQHPSTLVASNVYQLESSQRGQLQGICPQNSTNRLSHATPLSTNASSEGSSEWINLVGTMHHRDYLCFLQHPTFHSIREHAQHDWRQSLLAASLYLRSLAVVRGKVSAAEGTDKNSLAALDSDPIPFSKTDIGGESRAVRFYSPHGPSRNPDGTGDEDAGMETFEILATWIGWERSQVSNWNEVLSLFGGIWWGPGSVPSSSGV
jgi:hypothetical protein